MFNPVAAVFRWVAALLARLNVIDEDVGTRTADLAWPRMLTGFARLAQKTADVAMIGFALGPTAIAGMALGYLYWGLGNSLSLGLTGGTINQTSQRYGAGLQDEFDLAVKQSVWVGVLIALPFTVVYWFFAVDLIRLFGVDATTTLFGATYLQVLGLAMVPNFLNTIASRALAGADDTWIPMSIRSTAAVLNIVLNAVFIFGMGMGVLGAALGTVIAELFVMGTFVWGFLARRVPLVGAFPIGLSTGPPYFDRQLSRELLEISAPLMLRREVQRIARFPFYALLATFGPVTVAAYEIGRRIRSQMHAPGWGFSTAASSLVGQELGTGDEAGAERYAWDILRFSMAIYVINSALLFVFARQVAGLFVQEPETIRQTVPFIRVAAISLLAKGADASITGSLKATGDTNWPLYGQLLGLYVFMIPLAYVGAHTTLGLLALYLAILAETFVPAVVDTYRFTMGKWKAISRSYRPSEAGD